MQREGLRTRAGKRVEAELLQIWKCAKRKAGSAKLLVITLYHCNIDLWVVDKTKHLDIVLGFGK